MGIVVKPAYQVFNLKIGSEEENVVFGFKQLSYKIRGDISARASSVKNGEYSLDRMLQVFLTIKYGIKSVEGFSNEDGTAYQLKFEDNKKEALTDECVDELLATPITNELQYAAYDMGQAVMPGHVKNPLTGDKLEGVEIIPPSASGIQKK